VPRQSGEAGPGSSTTDLSWESYDKYFSISRTVTRSQIMGLVSFPPSLYFGTKHHYAYFRNAIIFLIF